MKKTFMGVRLKRLREEQRLTQAALAGKLGISLSYLNQLENNQRPLTVPVLLALNSVFGLDVQSFAEGDEARLISDLREALADPSLGEVDRCRGTSRTRAEHARGRARAGQSQPEISPRRRAICGNLRAARRRPSGRGGGAALHAVRGSPRLLLSAAQLHCRARRCGGSDRRPDGIADRADDAGAWCRISKAGMA